MAAADEFCQWLKKKSTENKTCDMLQMSSIFPCALNFFVKYINIKKAALLKGCENL